VGCLVSGRRPGTPHGPYGLPRDARRRCQRRTRSREQRRTRRTVNGIASLQTPLRPRVRIMMGTSGTTRHTRTECHATPLAAGPGPVDTEREQRPARKQTRTPLSAKSHCCRLDNLNLKATLGCTGAELRKMHIDWRGPSRQCWPSETRCGGFGG
jgi:hypothetical protein